MEKKTDLRVQRTYKMLIASFMDCLKEKNFDDITVAEICEGAMVRRATFYKHFGDKYDLFSFAIRQLQAQFKEANLLEYDASQPLNFYIAMTDQCFQFVEQHSDVFHSIIKSKSSNVLMDIISEEIEADISKYLKENADAGTPFPASAELLATILTGALIYTMKWWIVHEKKPSREELLAEFISLIKFL